MKYCPNCRTQYTDDTLKFCLQDGSPLVEANVSEIKTADYGETETIVSNRQPSRISIDYQTPSSEIRPQTANQTFSAPDETPKKSRTALIVAATMLITLIIVSGIGIGAWLYLKNNRTEIAKNNNSPANSVNQNAVQNASKNANSANDNKKTPSPTPKTSPNTNANTSNANVQTLPPARAAEIKKEVGETIDGWKDAGEAQNLDAQIEKYADKVDYYNKKDADIDFIRQDKERAFSQYDSVSLKISNLTVTPDATGKRATAIFDKEWDFEGEEKSSSGKVKTQLLLENKSGEWLITSEQDVKLYYKN